MPKKLGLEATSKNLNDLKLQKANEEKLAQERYENAKVLAKKIEERPVVVSIKAGKDGRAFGSVSTKEIAEAVKVSLDLKLIRRKWYWTNQLKQLERIL